MKKEIPCITYSARNFKGLEDIKLNFGNIKGVTEK